MKTRALCCRIGLLFLIGSATYSHGQTNPTTAPAYQTFDLLKLVDLEHYTIRKQWMMNKNVLQSGTWDDEHGPFIQFPITARGSYQVALQFKLQRENEAIYVRVPVLGKWALLVLSSGEQSFENIEGKQLKGTSAIPVNKLIHARFAMEQAERNDVNLSLFIENIESFKWNGPTAKLGDSGEVWEAGDPMCFAVGGKNVEISELNVLALGSSVIARKPLPQKPIVAKRGERSMPPLPTASQRAASEEAEYQRAKDRRMSGLRELLEARQSVDFDRQVNRPTDLANDQKRIERIQADITRQELKMAELEKKRSDRD